MDNNTCSIKPKNFENLNWATFSDLYFNKMTKCMSDYIDYQNGIISFSYINHVKNNPKLGDFCGNKDSYTHPDGIIGFCERSEEEKKEDPPFLSIVCESIQSRVNSNSSETAILNKYRKGQAKDEDILNLNIIEFILSPNKKLYDQFLELYGNNKIEFFKLFWFYILPIFYFDIEKVKEGILDNTLLKGIIDQAHIVPDGFYQVIQKQLNIKPSADSNPIEVFRFIFKYILLLLINQNPDKKDTYIDMIESINEITLNNLSTSIQKVQEEEQPFETIKDDEINNLLNCDSYDETEQEQPIEKEIVAPQPQLAPQQQPVKESKEDRVIKRRTDFLQPNSPIDEEMNLDYFKTFQEKDQKYFVDLNLFILKFNMNLQEFTQSFTDDKKDQLTKISKLFSKLEDVASNYNNLINHIANPSPEIDKQKLYNTYINQFKTRLDNLMILCVELYGKIMTSSSFDSKEIITQLQKMYKLFSTMRDNIYKKDTTNIDLQQILQNANANDFLFPIPSPKQTIPAVPIHEDELEAQLDSALAAMESSMQGGGMFSFGFEFNMYDYLFRWFKDFFKSKLTDYVTGISVGWISSLASNFIRSKILDYLTNFSDQFRKVTGLELDKNIILNELNKENGYKKMLYRIFCRLNKKFADNTKEIKQFFMQKFNDLSKNIFDLMNSIKIIEKKDFNQYLSKIPNINILGIYGTQIIYGLFPKMLLNKPKNDLILSFFQVLSQDCNKHLKELKRSEDLNFFKEINLNMSKCFKQSIKKILENSLNYILSQPIPYVEDLDFDRAEASEKASQFITDFLFPESEFEKVKKELIKQEVVTEKDLNDTINTLIRYRHIFNSDTEMKTAFEYIKIKYRRDRDVAEADQPIFGSESGPAKKNTSEHIPIDDFLEDNILGKRKSVESKRNIKQKIAFIEELAKNIDMKQIESIYHIGKKLFEKKTLTKETGAVIDSIANLIKSLNLIKFNLITQFEETVKIIKVVFVQFVDSLGLELFFFQFFGAFYNALSNPKSDLNKSIVSKNIIDILKALLRLFRNNLPTTIHKILQMVDPLIKESDFSSSYLYWFGPKLRYPVMGDIEVDIIQDQLIKNESKRYVKLGKFLTSASVGQVYKLEMVNKEDKLTELFEQFDILMLNHVNYDFINLEFKKYVYENELIELKNNTIELLTSTLPTLTKLIFPIYNCLIIDKFISHSVNQEKITVFKFMCFLIKMMKKYDKEIDQNLAFYLGKHNVNMKLEKNPEFRELLQWISDLNELDLDKIRTEFKLDTYDRLCASFLTIINQFIELIDFKKSSGSNVQAFIDKNCINTKKYDLFKFRLEFMNLSEKMNEIKNNYHKFRNIIFSLKSKKEQNEIKYGLESNVIKQIPVFYKYITKVILHPFELKDKIIKFIKIRNRMMMCLENQVFPGSISQIIRDQYYLKLDGINENEKNNIKNNNTSIFELDVLYGLRINSDEMEGYNFLINTYKTIFCKIKDVLDEFDLWEEIVNTMKAYSLYTYNSNYLEEGINFRIITADVKPTFKHIEGVQPRNEYIDEHGEEFHTSFLKDNDIQDLLAKEKIYQKKHYMAVIQTSLPGPDIVDLEKNIKENKLSDNEMICLRNAFNFFITQFLDGIIKTGRYHGDPHGGNLKWEYNSEYNKGTLSILDFGDFPEISQKYRILVLGLLTSGIVCSLLNSNNKQYLLQYISDLILNSYGFQNYSIGELERLYKLNIDKDYILVDSKSLSVENEINLKYMLVKSIQGFFELEITNAIQLKYKDIGKSISLIDSLVNFTGDELFIDSLIGKIDEQVICKTISADIKRVCQAFIKIFNTARFIGIDQNSIILAFIKLNFNNLSDDGKKVYNILNTLKAPMEVFKIMRQNTKMTVAQICGIIITPIIFIPYQSYNIASWVNNFFGIGRYISSAIENFIKGKELVIGVFAAGIAVIAGTYAYFKQEERTKEAVKESIKQLIQINRISTISKYLSTLINIAYFLIFDGIKQSDLGEIFQNCMSLFETQKTKEKSTDTNDYLWNNTSLYPNGLTGFIDSFQMITNLSSSILKPIIGITSWLNDKVPQFLNFTYKTFYLDYTKINTITSFKENTNSLTDPTMTNLVLYKDYLKEKKILANNKIILNNDSILYLDTLMRTTLKYEETIDLLKKYCLTPEKTPNEEFNEDYSKIRLTTNLITSLFHFKLALGEDLKRKIENVLIDFLPELSKEERFETYDYGPLGLDEFPIPKTDAEIRQIKIGKVEKVTRYYLGQFQTNNPSKISELLFRIIYYKDFFYQLKKNFDYVKMFCEKKKAYQKSIIIKTVLLYHFMKLKKTIYPDILYSCLVELSSFAYKTTINEQRDGVTTFPMKFTFQDLDLNINSSFIGLDLASFDVKFDYNFEFWQFDFRKVISSDLTDDINNKKIRSVCSYLEMITANDVKSIIQKADFCELKGLEIFRKGKYCLFKQYDSKLEEYKQTIISNGAIILKTKDKDPIRRLISFWEDFSFLLSYILNKPWNSINDKCKIELPKENDKFENKFIVSDFKEKYATELEQNTNKLVEEMQTKKDYQSILLNWKASMMKKILVDNLKHVKTDADKDDADEEDDFQTATSSSEFEKDDIPSIQPSAPIKPFQFTANTQTNEPNAPVESILKKKQVLEKPKQLPTKLPVVPQSTFVPFIPQSTVVPLNPQSTVVPLNLQSTVVPLNPQSTVVPPKPRVKHNPAQIYSKKVNKTFPFDPMQDDTLLLEERKLFDKLLDIKNDNNFPLEEPFPIYNYEVNGEPNEMEQKTMGMELSAFLTKYPNSNSDCDDDNQLDCNAIYKSLSQNGVKVTSINEAISLAIKMIIPEIEKFNAWLRTAITNKPSWSNTMLTTLFGLLESASSKIEPPDVTYDATMGGGKNSKKKINHNHKKSKRKIY